MSVNLGMRGAGDFGPSGARPNNYREGILFQWPNGSAPLTAMLAMLKSERVDDQIFNWFTKTLDLQGGAVTTVYTDAAMTTAYVSGGVAGDTVFVKCAEAVATVIRAGHQVMLRVSSDLEVDVNAKVTSVLLNGASSQVACKLLEADDNSATKDLSDCNIIRVIGNINSDGGAMPTAISYDPSLFTNYIQTFRTPIDMTRIASKTKLRTGDQKKEAMREALEYHSIEMEKALFFGKKSLNTGTNGKPEYTTDGIITLVRASGNVGNYVTDAAFSGQSWTTGGENWLNGKLEEIFRYGSGEKMAFVGSGVLLGLDRLAKTGGQIQLHPMDMAYGIKVMQWVTPYGTLYVKSHPLFSMDSTLRYAMVIVEPKRLVYKFIDDTHYVDRMASTTNDVAMFGEYMTDCGLELHFPNEFGWLTGFNQLNTV